MTELETDINVLRVGLRDIETVQLPAYDLCCVFTTHVYEGRSKSFEPYPFKRKVDKWAYLYFSAYSPPLSVHSLYW